MTQYQIIIFASSEIRSVLLFSLLRPVRTVSFSLLFVDNAVDKQMCWQNDVTVNVGASPTTLWSSCQIAQCQENQGRIDIIVNYFVDNILVSLH